MAGSAPAWRVECMLAKRPEHGRGSVRSPSGLPVGSRGRWSCRMPLQFSGSVFEPATRSLRSMMRSRAARLEAQAAAADGLGRRGTAHCPAAVWRPLRSRGQSRSLVADHHLHPGLCGSWWLFSLVLQYGSGWSGVGHGDEPGTTLRSAPRRLGTRSAADRRSRRALTASFPRRRRALSRAARDSRGLRHGDSERTIRRCGG